MVVRPSGQSGGQAAYLAMLPEVMQRENDALDQKLAQYKRQEEEEEEEREERLPDLEKDDMLARRTKVFHKYTSNPAYNRFLPLPGSKVQLPREGALSSHKALGKTIDTPTSRVESPKEEVILDRPKDGKELRWEDLHQNECAAEMMCSVVVLLWLSLASASGYCVKVALKETICQGMTV